MYSGVLKILAMIATSVFISGCKLAVVVDNGGIVQVASDSRHCSQDSPCTFEVTGANFSDTFTAVPHPGYKFKGWHAGPGYLCSNTPGPVCTLSNTVLKDVPAIKAIIASDAVFTLRPVFTSTGGAKLKVKDANGALLGEVMDLKNGTDAAVRQVYVEKNGNEHGYMVDVNRMYINDSYGYTLYWLNPNCTGKVVYATSPLILEPLFSNRYMVVRKEKSRADTLLLLNLSPPEDAKILEETYAMEDSVCKQIATSLPLVPATILDEDYGSRYTPPFGVYAE